MKRTNFYFSFTGVAKFFTLAALVTMFASQASAQITGTCKGSINVSLPPATCSYQFVPADIVASGSASYVFREDQGPFTAATPPAVVTSKDIGKTIRVGVASGPFPITITCWGYVTVEDKSGPTVTCPGNVAVNCSTPTTPVFTGDFGIIVAKGGASAQTLAAGATNGTFTDCSLTLANSNLNDEAYTDVATGTVCAGNYSIARTWTVTDHYGNKSAPCTQTITVTPANPGGYTVDNFNVPCTLTDYSPDGLYAAGFTANGVGVKGVTGGRYSPYPYLATDTLKKSSCIQVSYTDTRMDVCPGSYMIMRQWKLFYCGTSYTNGLLQQINVTNTTLPAATVNFFDYSPSGDKICYRDLWGNIDTLGANLKCVQTKRSVAFGAVGTVTTTNAPLGNTYACAGDASFTFALGAPACGGYAVLTSNDSRFKVTGSGAAYAASAVGLPAGHTIVTFTLTDPCSGLKSDITIDINVTDNVLPEPVCIQDTKVSIGSDGKVRMPASALNSGSHDNCGVAQIFASRMDQKAPVNGTGTSCGTLVADLCDAANKAKDNRIWSDWVEFGCADLKAPVQVMLGVLDNHGNFNFCMVNVTVENKIQPTCTSPVDVTVACSKAAASLANLPSFGAATGWTNCGVATPAEGAPSGALDNCKTGTITRNFTVTDCAGQTATCSQKITFTPSSGFVVDFPDDITVSCLSAIPSATDLRNQMLDPASWTKGLDGSILNRGCGVINVNITDAPFTANPGLPTADVCGKILRKITVIDWCKYNPNNDLTDLNANCYGNPVLGDFHGYGGGSKATNLATWQNLDQYRQNNGPAGNYNEVYAALYTGGTIQLKDANGNYYITSQDRRFEDADVYYDEGLGVDYGPRNTTIVAGLNPTHDRAFADGILCFIQIIKVVDKEAPKSTPKDVTVCDYGSGTPCYGLYRNQLVVTDGCGGQPTNFPNGNGGVASSVRVNWVITDASGNVVAQNASNDFTGLIQDPSTGLGLSLPYGTYTVTYTGTDLCMNIGGPWAYKVTLKDCKTPSLTCYQTVSALMNAATPGQGTVQVWASEILSSVADNCTSDADLKKGATITLGSATTPGTAKSLPINCFDYNAAKANGYQIGAKVWIQDAAGNVNNCFVNIQLQDNGGACVINPVAPLAGAVKTETNQAVSAVTVNSNVNGTTVAGSAATDANGAYSISSLAIGANYQAKAAKANMGDRATDVTTWDIALVSQHVLGIKALGSAYKIIAADVDKSGEVDATDMLHMRRFILGITSSLPAGTWRFIDKSYAFKNVTNPFGEDFPEYVNVNNFTSASSANFVAIEIGDVNNSYAFAPEAVVRTAKTVTLNVNDMNVVAGNEYTVNVTASELNATALQGTFSFDGATVTGLTPGNLNGIADANFNVKANAVATSWNGEAAKDATVASFTIRADKSGKLSDMLSFGSAITKSEANDATGNSANVTLKFNTGKVSGGEFALYQNTPNPVEGSTKIGFNLPSDQTARLSVIAVDGKVMLTKSISGKAGYNEVSINKTELNASGVFHYRLDTQDNSATKKMIIIE